MSDKELNNDFDDNLDDLIDDSILDDPSMDLEDDGLMMSADDEDDVDLSSHDDDEIDEEEDDEDEEDDSEDEVSQETGGVVKLVAAGAIGLVLFSFAGYNMLKQNGFVGQPEQMITPQTSASFEPYMQPQNQAAPVVMGAQEGINLSASSSAVDLSASSDASLILEDAKPSNAISIDSPGPVGGFDTATLRSIIAEELDKQSGEDKIWIEESAKRSVNLTSPSTSVLMAKLEALTLKLAEVNAALEKQLSKSLSQKSALPERLSTKEVSALTKNRYRIPGFQVLTASQDYSTAIVKSSTGRIMAFFAGEKFTIGSQKYTVSAVHDNGHLLLIGDKHYIDGVIIEPPKAVKKSTAQAKPKPEKPAPKAEEKTADVTPTKVAPSEPSVRRKPDAIAAQKLEAPIKVRNVFGDESPTTGWSFHGIFDDGYLLNTPSGDWVILTNGQFVEGIGRVSGVDSSRQLVIGAHIIPLSR
jgi:hypothetical protein